MNTDLSVFTNMEDVKLKDRLEKVLTNSNYFDVLVGYFRMTGFYKLYKNLNEVQEIRILIGLGIDRKTVDMYQQSIDDVSKTKYLQSVQLKVEKEFIESDDNAKVEEGVHKFLEWLNSGKLKIRMTANRDVHAKLYIIRKNQDLVPDQFGNLITGSSNFSLSGLEKNIEFNVELKNSADVKYALEFFNKLWSESIEISEDIIDLVRNNTWMKSDITPYEMYLKTIYEYFEEELDENDKIQLNLPPGFMKLKYQEHAVKQAYKIIEMHGGVFISDVVGLGKTIIAAMLSKSLKGRKLFIVPPVIKQQWEEILKDFDLPRSDTVESSGKIDQIFEWHDIDTYDYIFVDEAHKFRNSSSKTYDMLKDICYGKRVVLITATPQNNNILDIANLITLFQDSRRSSIMPKCKDLEAYFGQLHAKIKSSIGTDEEHDTIKHVTEKIRKDILKSIMIRRTRTEIQEYYNKDLSKQGLVFPEIKPPKRLVYKYSANVEKIFYETINLLKQLSYARYTPLLYLKDKKKLGDRKAGQENMKGFIKTLLIKRLESSIFAFKKSIQRLTDSYDHFLDLWSRDQVIIGGMSRSKIDLSDLVRLTDDELINLKLDGSVEVFNKDEFMGKYDTLLSKDKDVFHKLKSIWDNVDYIKDDYKYDQLVKELSNMDLSNRVIIFSESKETVDYLNSRLYEDFNGLSISYSGSESERRKDYIKQNFDPNYQGNQLEDKYILITTDSMSEGINLHKSNTVLNYDLPWNPTRIMQRVGRINRIGTKFKELHILNFFPAINSKKHLTLEEAIKIKIDMFHSLLGADAKYVTDDEDIEVHGLYESIMNIIDAETEEEHLDSLRQSLLSEIIEIKDNDSKLYNKIKNLPIKSSLSRLGQKEGLITFIKQGLIKEFYFIRDLESTSENIDFEDAIQLLKAKPEESNVRIPSNYFKLLDQNKMEFDNLITTANHLEQTARTSANEKVVRKWIKFILKTENKEREYIQKVYLAISEGKISPYKMKILSKKLKKCKEVKQAVTYINNTIPDKYLTRRENYSLKQSKREKKVVILSEYIKKDINTGVEL